MLCSGVTATLMIMMNGIILTHSASTKEFDQKIKALPSQVHLRHQSPLYDKCKYYQYSASETSRISKCPKKQLMRYLILKLKIVIDSFEEKKESLKTIYSQISTCGLNKCGELRGLFPENENLQNFNCSKFKKPNRLEKHTSLLLSNLSKGVHNSFTSFQDLISLENEEGNRTRILHELKNHMKTLGYEINDLRNSMRNKRLNFNQKKQERSVTPQLFLNPQAPTDLMIREWVLIQQSEAFLKEWKRNLPKVFKCWKQIKKYNFSKRKLHPLHGYSKIKKIKISNVMKSRFSYSISN